MNGYHASIVDSIVQVQQDSRSTHIDTNYVLYNVATEAQRNTLHDWYVFQTGADFPVYWFDSCEQYIDRLPKSDKFIVRAYTRHGDEVVNAYLRNGPDFFSDARMQDLLFNTMLSEDTLVYAVQLFRYKQDEMDENIEDCFNRDGAITSIGSRYISMYGPTLSKEEIIQLLNEYILDLRMLIANAPPIPRAILVFRGVRRDYLNREGEIAEQKGFTSTSLDPDIASEFAGDGRSLYEFTLLPGTRCMAMGRFSNFPIESEVLLDTDLFVQSDRAIDKHFLNIRPGVGEFPPEHFWNPINVPYKSRRVLCSSDRGNSSNGGNGGNGMMDGGFQKVAKQALAAKQTRRVSKSVRSLKKLKVGTKRSTKRSIRRSKQLSPRMIRTPWKFRDYSDPVVQYGVPVPVAVSAAIKAAAAAYKAKSTRRFS